MKIKIELEFENDKDFELFMELFKKFKEAKEILDKEETEKQLK